jgi:urea transport system ATP-binding protein
VAFPEFWLYFLGALFIAVTLFLPNGIVGLFRKAARRSARHDARPDGAGRARRAWRTRPSSSQPCGRKRRPQRRYGRVARHGVPDFTQGVALYLDDITVSFDGFKALNKLSLTINVGELRCIIGPNGAGKTTMMDCITGKTRPDSGTRLLRQHHRPAAPERAEIAQVGIGRKFQKPTVYEQLSVFENLELALRRRPPRARQPVSRLTGSSSTASARC